MNTPTASNRLTVYPGPFLCIAKALRLLTMLFLSMSANPLRADQFGDFTYSNNGSAITITGYTGSGGAVVIPSTIVGLPVTGIGTYAFYFKPAITSISFPASIVSFGTNPFGYCTGLTSLIMDAANPYYSSLNGVLFNKAQSLLIQYPAGKTGSYIIPAGVNEIGASGFASCISLTAVTIPTSLTTIGSDAFYACQGLASITIPAGVTSLGSRALGYCRDLLSIQVDAANPSYASLGGVLFNKAQTLLIQYPTALTGVYTIPNSVTNVGNAAFTNCKLSGVMIPSSVTAIGNQAFYNCTSLTSISLPASVTSIGLDALTACFGLQSFSVDALNPNFSSLNGVLFNKTKTTLIQYPAAKPSEPYIVPATVTSIGAQAFYYADITSVVIPASVTSVGHEAFSGCTSLLEATFEGNAPAMGAYAFSGLYPPFTIYFYNGATGYTTPTWEGYPSQMLTGGGGTVLADAVDAPSLTFTTGGMVPWLAQNTITHDGIDAAASGDIGNNQESWMETTVNGPGTISFWWSTASDPNDFLGFYVDGVLQSGSISQPSHRMA